MALLRVRFLQCKCCVMVIKTDEEEESKNKKYTQRLLSSSRSSGLLTSCVKSCNCSSVIAAVVVYDVAKAGAAR